MQEDSKTPDHRTPSRQVPAGAAAAASGLRTGGRISTSSRASVDSAEVTRVAQHPSLRQAQWERDMNISSDDDVI